MLVLSRKVGQHIVIGPDITVQVLEIKGNKCRIGISAPAELSVDRLEVAERKRAEIET